MVNESTTSSRGVVNESDGAVEYRILEQNVPSQSIKAR